jgi:Ca2+-binding EF-hand superfamily protein
LLERLGISVIPGIVKELVQEVGVEIPGHVNSTEFEQLVTIIRTRGGFTLKETQKLMNLYQRYDHNQNGKIDRKELMGILDWLGLSNGQERWKQMNAHILNALKQYSGQEVGEAEFLHLMRVFRELEIAEFSRQFHEEDLDGTGTLDINGVVALISDVGFKMPTEEAVLECAAKCGVPPDRTEYYFDDALSMAHAFRAVEGFSRSDFAEIKEVFKHNDRDDSGAIDVVELGSVLRWLGNPADVETTQDLMEEIDVDKSGYVDFEELLKVVRRFREDQLTQVETIWKTADRDTSGGLDLKELKFLILTLGYHPTEAQTKMLQEKYGHREICYKECVGLVQTFREETRDAFRQQQGFAKKELNHMKAKFNRLDKSGTGQIGQSDLMALVADVFPEARRASGAEIDQIFAKFGISTDRIRFPEYLQLMRMVKDRSDYNAYLRQIQAAKENGFSPAEVMEIRKIFNLCDADHSHVVDFSELEELFIRILPKAGDRTGAMLKQLRDSDDDGDGRLDFSEFLTLIRTVMDSGMAEEALLFQSAKGDGGDSPPSPKPSPVGQRGERKPSVGRRT